MPACIPPQPTAALPVSVRAAPADTPSPDGAPAPIPNEGGQPSASDEAQRIGPVRPEAPAAADTAWDDADSHKWIGAGWGSDATSSLLWSRFHGRDCLEVRWDYPAWLGYVHTDLFPAENWELPVTGLQADVYVESCQSWTDIGLEPKDPDFNTIELLWGNATNLMPNQWHTVSWYFTQAADYQAVAGLVLKLDQLGNATARVYLDNIRLLVAGEAPELWDDMDDGSRWWAYAGNWYNWSWRDWGLEPISHRADNPSTPAGSIYLQWDHPNGTNPTLASAEVGTSKLEDKRDWSGYNRIAADIKVSDPDVPLSVFFWDEEGSTTPVDRRGFGTSTRKAGVADSWQRITWDLPWPPWFDNTNLDEVKFVVNNIDTHLSGTLYLDNISLVSDTLPSPLSGLSYTFEDFNDRNASFNDFNGNWGTLNSAYITPTFVTATHAGSWGASLRVDYDLASESFVGIWQSLWGHSDYTQTQSLDFTDIYGNLNEANKDFEQIHFWVRGSGVTTGTHNVKVELKDYTNDYNRTAYRYLAIDDGDTTWREVVLDADVTNASFWSYNGQPPDPTRMKQLVLVVERYFNNPSGTFYLDDIHFVDADDGPFDPGQHSDDEFLDFVSKRTFLYFLDWYDPNTGLFQDRSIFPDLESTAATGFGLTALAIGESRDWLDRDLAIEMITRTLQTLHDGQSAADTVTDTISGTNGYRGFFYHFLDDEGLRKDEGSELSSVDTALLLAGVLTVREHFHDVPDIVDLAGTIYQRVEWDWMLDPDNDQFHLAWKPELDAANGYTDPTPGGGYFTEYHWDYYTDEVILINLLAIGSPTHPVSEDVFYAWTRHWASYGGHSFIHSWNGSFFTYVFAHLWVDFVILGTDNHPDPSQRVDWWDNSVAAAWANWQFAVDHEDDAVCDTDEEFATYGQASWGLTAAEGPDGGYHAYGAPPVDPLATQEHDGTIAPYGAGMAVMFLAEKAMPALRHYFTDTDLWRYRFGYGDAYSLDPPSCDGPWYDHAAFGIDQGPLLISIENYRSGLIWNTMRQSRYLRDAVYAVYERFDVYLPLVLREYDGGAAQFP